MPLTSLGLSACLVRAMTERGHIEPTPIQAAAIPEALLGRDVLASAQTGSGKTAAFLLPLLHRLEHDRRAPPARTQALVLVPTRELAGQVADVARDLARHVESPIKVAELFGGVSINPQMMALRGGADLVIATPGRLLDLIDHNALTLMATPMLVLDEADRLLDSGFADELGRIVALMPRRRQTLLFSATFPQAVQALAERLLKDPFRIEVAAVEAAEAPAITQRAIEVDAGRRTQLLRQLIRDEGWARVLVFVATQYASDHVAGKLRQLGLAAVALNGSMSQGARTQALADFRSGRLQVLIATDIMARGIDIVDLPVVLNYDLPRSAVDHVHRIGRTGRAGAEGLAISFIGAASEAHFRLIEKRQGQRVARERIAGFEPLDVATPEAATGGIKGKRKSKKDKLREAAARGG